MVTQEELKTVRSRVGQVQGVLSAYQAASSGTSDESAMSNHFNAWSSAQNAVNDNFLNRDRRTLRDGLGDTFFDIGTWTKEHWTLLFMLVLMIGKRCNLGFSFTS